LLLLLCGGGLGGFLEISPYCDHIWVVVSVVGSDGVGHCCYDAFLLFFLLEVEMFKLTLQKQSRNSKDLL